MERSFPSANEIEFSIQQCQLAFSKGLNRSELYTFISVRLWSCCQSALKAHMGKTKRSHQLPKEWMDAKGESLYIGWACGQLH